MIYCDIIRRCSSDAIEMSLGFPCDFIDVPCHFIDVPFDVIEMSLGCPCDLGPERRLY